jgi:hypothetical protein
MLPARGSGNYLPGGRPPVNVSRKGGRSPPAGARFARSILPLAHVRGSVKTPGFRANRAPLGIIETASTRSTRIYPSAAIAVRTCQRRPRGTGRRCTDDLSREEQNILLQPNPATTEKGAIPCTDVARNSVGQEGKIEWGRATRLSPAPANDAENRPRSGQLTFSGGVKLARTPPRL